MQDTMMFFSFQMTNMKVHNGPVPIKMTTFSQAVKTLSKAGVWV